MEKNKPKQLLWQFNENDSSISVSKESYKCDDESRFKFKITRLKNKESFEESLRIECFDDAKPNGEIYTSLIHLDSELKQFLKYGVAFSGSIFSSLNQTIRNNYFKISVNELKANEYNPSMLKDAVMKDILKMLGEEIERYKKDKKRLYNIPVKEFNDIINDSIYNNYNLIEIKRWLSNKGFTICNPGRFSKTIKDKKDKPLRVISFDSEKIKEYLPIKESDIEDIEDEK